jgi:hypothetical protein
LIKRTSLRLISSIGSLGLGISIAFDSLWLLLIEADQFGPGLLVDAQQFVAWEMEASKLNALQEALCRYN